jgi:uncharacterized protein YjbI with pentapeptide repeats
MNTTSGNLQDAVFSSGEEQGQSMQVAAVSPAEVQALLGAANNASEKISLMHLGFMAACAYNLIVVFSTTDMDLLVGKGVKLPLIDVEVPIVGFYVIVPYIVVLMHFNLLLQLQMLSRTLYAYDAAANPSRTSSVPIKKFKKAIAAPKHRGNWFQHGGLHISPYSSYLIGNTSNSMHRCLGTMVGITILLLPLFALLGLQLRFLAYQNYWYTWSHRLAVWADVWIVLVLWPLFMSRTETWVGYWKRIIIDIWICKYSAVVCAVLWVAWIARLFVHDTWVNDKLAAFLEGRKTLANLVGRLVKEPSDVPFYFTLSLLCLSFFGIVLFFQTRKKYCECKNLQGILPYLLVLAIGTLMPLALTAKGEWLEKYLGDTNFSESARVKRFRTLNLTGQVILAKNGTPEIVGELRAGGARAKKALNQVVALNLKGRSLRGAELTNAVLTGADLSRADIAEAKLYGAHLEYTILDEANLSYANAMQAHLEGANLSKAKLEHACLYQANLQGVFLAKSEAAFADFESANLKGADLYDSKLDNANFLKARLEGANFFYASLLSTNFGGSHIENTDLTRKNGVETGRPYSMSECRWQWAWPRGEAWSRLEFILKGEPMKKQEFRLKNTRNVSNIIMDLCTAGVDTKVDCGQTMDPPSEKAFKRHLYSQLMKYACESPAIATTLLLQSYAETSRRAGFPEPKGSKDSDWSCDVMETLSQEDVSKLQLKWEERLNGKLED